MKNNVRGKQMEACSEDEAQEMQVLLEILAVTEEEIAAGQTCSSEEVIAEFCNNREARSRSLLP